MYLMTAVVYSVEWRVYVDSEI